MGESCMVVLWSKVYADLLFFAFAWVVSFVESCVRVVY
ncbi:hypothetical protein BRPE64_BCDS01320 [Caballeronia insecticola]|uniref:Uncharacterized protein n=1 Tax=Caballeronia insecticola TaxID=758793 RepID=R4WJW3_9BURK|nr:hypothetical protein BRPE64_BCDS01320 [Caballeronia insecticola]